VIDRETSLAEFLGPLRHAPWVALDTEADSLHAYPEKLCLLQFSIPELDVLVDPLAGLDLAPLFRILAGQRLILHGADYDLRLLWRTFGFVPISVFDTMLAARLLGFKELSYDALVTRFVGVRLEKGPQRADWAKRPLTDRMVTYALNDSRYLKPVHDALVGELEQKGRQSWHAETCARLVTDSSQPREEDRDLVWRVKGAHALDRCGLAVLRRLWHWRDDEARRASRPPFFVLSHDALVAVAAAVAHGNDWAGLLPRHLSPRRREGLRTAVEEALALPAAEWPVHRRPTGPRFTMAQRRRCDDLRRRRDRAAHALGLDPAILAPRSLLVELAADWDRGQAQLMDWQRQFLVG
jgi:ribonuclease D